MNKRSYAPIIGFTGLAQSGKSASAKWISDSYGWRVIKMADPLKAMLYSVGLTKEHLEGGLKSVPCRALCNKTPRHAMQTLGTEWGRQLIGEDLWVNLWRIQAEKFLGVAGVICDDVRFDNEINTIHEMGGIIVRIERPGQGQKDDHLSERVPEKFDVMLDNAGTLPDLFRTVDAFFDSVEFSNDLPDDLPLTAVEA
jgi:hypothetical protein